MFIEILTYTINSFIMMAVKCNYTKIVRFHVILSVTKILHDVL